MGRRRKSPDLRLTMTFQRPPVISVTGRHRLMPTTPPVIAPATPPIGRPKIALKRKLFPQLLPQHIHPPCECAQIANPVLGATGTILCSGLRLTLDRHRDVLPGGTRGQQGA